MEPCAWKAGLQANLWQGIILPELRNSSVGKLSPGPGHFTPKHIGPHHPAPSFHGTAGPQPRNSIPGPGAFAVERADKICKPTSPSVSIGLRWQEPGRSIAMAIK